MSTITLSAAWRQTGKRWASIKEIVLVKRPASHYHRCPWVPEGFRYASCEDELHARMSIGRVRRIIAFMDATGFQAYASWERRFRYGKGLPSYADHTLVWRDADKQFLVTTEPYGLWSEEEIGSRTPEGWRVLKMPPGFGIWRPCLPNGAADTEFILLSPPKNGADLDTIALRLFRWGPYGTHPALI